MFLIDLALHPVAIFSRAGGATAQTLTPDLWCCVLLLIHTFRWGNRPDYTPDYTGASDSRANPPQAQSTERVSSTVRRKTPDV